MKKLMVMMAAIATGFLAFGEFAEHTVNFAGGTAGEAYNWTAAEDGAYYWFYDGTEGLTYAAPIVGDSTCLELKTSGKKLSRGFLGANAARETAEFEAAAIGEAGLFFDSKINFLGQVSDEIPTNELSSAKLALLLLDTTDMGASAPAATNLYVIAGYGTDGGTALYQLNTAITPAWLTSTHEVTIKAYANILSGATGRGGFMVYIDGADDAEAVMKVYPITAGVADFTHVMVNADIAELNGGIASAVQGWYAGRQLVPSISNNAAESATLRAVDFAGNAKIDYVKLTGTKPSFIPDDAITMDVGDKANIITSITDGGVEVYADGKITVAAQPESPLTVTIDRGSYDIVKFAVGDGAATVVTGDSFTFEFEKGETLTVTAANSKAQIGDKLYETFAEALADIATAEAGTILKLNSNLTADDLAGNDQFEFAAENEVVLDLNGKTITGGAEADRTVLNTGKLIIKDTVGTGSIVAPTEGDAVMNVGTLTIQGGFMNGAVTTTGQGTTTATGGTFAADPSAFVATGYKASVITEGTLWEVVPLAKVQLTISAENATVTGVKAGEFTEGTACSFTVAANTDYEVKSVTVSGATATETQGTYSFTVGTEAITITVVTEKAAPAGITITITKSTGVTDVQTNGASVVDATITLPPETTSIELTLVADGITIPVFKCDGVVTTKTATYDIVNGTTLTFTAEAASTEDPDVKDDDIKRAIVDAIDAGDSHDAAVAKVNAVVGEGANQVKAKDLATYINNNNITSGDLAESDYVAASVKLGTDALITEETEVKIVDLTTGEGGAMTFEVDIDDVAAVEAIKNMVKASDDLADWDLEVTAGYKDNKVTITPVEVTDKAFMKVVIPQDPSTDK